MFTCLSSALTEDLWGQEPHPMILGFLDPGHKHILKDAREAVRLPALSTHHPLSFWVESRKFLVTAPTLSTVAACTSQCGSQVFGLGSCDCSAPSSS